MKLLRALYFIVANTLILFAVLVVCAHFAILAHRDHIAKSQYAELPGAVKRNYQHMTPAEVDDLLYTFATIRYRYAPWVGMDENQTRSRFVNVNEYGIRSNGSGERPIAEIEGAIWFFGGSTTFGYGVADAETIPARLEQLTGRPVVNFGSAGYFSAQENVLLDQYLKAGYRPAMVIFLDGINESCDIDDYQDEMKLIFAKAQEGYSWHPMDVATPLVYALSRLRLKAEKTLGSVAEKPTRDELACESYGRKFELREIVARVLAERDSLCRLYAVECRTFVQPFAGVHGKFEDDVTKTDRLAMRTKFEHLAPVWRAAHSVFVTDAFDGLPRHAYVDEAHYSAEANRLLAQAIARYVTRSPG